MNTKRLTDNEIFDLAIRKEELGERFHDKHSLNLKDFRDYKQSHQFFLDGYRVKSNQLLKPFPKIIYNYINKVTFNAHAFKYKEYYIIAIHLAVWAIITDLFHRMLAHKEILKGIGNPNKESSATSIGDYYDDVADLLINTPLDKFSLKFPKDTTRQHYAYHLSGLAMDFIFEHELAHILFGHVDYLSNCLSMNCISEFQSSEILYQNQFNLQTLEMNADTMGLASCISRAINAIKDNSLVNFNYRIFYKDKYQVFSDLAFAVFNTLRVFGDGDYKETRIGKSTHPNPGVRQVILLSFLEQIMQSQQTIKIEHEKLHELLIKIMVESENAYKLITGKEHNRYVYTPEYFANHPLTSRLPINWKENIRNKLMNYTFVPLPT
ncbi:MAG: hypothetical protein MUO72_13045 [Bacteroidales bacterium]|nr:hypothetical protein [Bacteroidales bacterium]